MSEREHFIHSSYTTWSSLTSFSHLIVISGISLWFSHWECHVLLLPSPSFPACSAAPPGRILENTLSPSMPGWPAAALPIPPGLGTALDPGEKTVSLKRQWTLWKLPPKANIKMQKMTKKSASMRKYRHRNIIFISLWSMSIGKGLEKI